MNYQTKYPILNRLFVQMLLAIVVILRRLAAVLLLCVRVC